MKLNYFSIIVFVFATFQMYFFQLKKLKINDPSSCIKTFKSNNFLGLIILLGLILGKI